MHQVAVESDSLHLVNALNSVEYDLSAMGVCYSERLEACVLDLLMLLTLFSVNANVMRLPIASLLLVIGLVYCAPGGRS